MTRSFHVDTSQRDAKDLEGHSDSYDLGQEEAGLTSSAQTNPRSNGSTHSPSRDEHY